MIDVAFYSIVGFLCAFAPNYSTLLVLRLLYGIGMGGEWGLGASLAMEKVPPRRRGLVSGVLQQGYALGYLLAAGAYLADLQLHAAGDGAACSRCRILPALLSLFVRARVTESEAWEETRRNVAENRTTTARQILSSPRCSAASSTWSC